MLNAHRQGTVGKLQARHPAPRRCGGHRGLFAGPVPLEAAGRAERGLLRRHRHLHGALLRRPVARISRRQVRDRRAAAMDGKDVSVNTKVYPACRARPTRWCGSLTQEWRGFKVARRQGDGLLADLPAARTSSRPSSPSATATSAQLVAALNHGRRRLTSAWIDFDVADQRLDAVAGR